MASSLKLIAATPDVTNRVAQALTGRGITCCSQGQIVVVESVDQYHALSAVAVLRDTLSASERDAVSVATDLDFPHEFPVTMRLEAWWSAFETTWFTQAISAGAFSVWFQPIVDTAARRILGNECLIRLTKGHRRDGAEIIAAAAAHRDLRGFDAYARHLAIRAISAQTSPEQKAATYFVNFLPGTIHRPANCLGETMRMLNQAGLPLKHFVMEAVLSNCNPDVAHLRRIRDYLGEQDVRFALDDVAADAEALRMIAELRPDFIKLENRLVHRMDRGGSDAAVRRLVEVAEPLGVRVVAKGVERASTMQRLQQAGVTCMQGYLFGSPSPEVCETAMQSTNSDLVNLSNAAAMLPEWREALVSLGFEATN